MTRADLIRENEALHGLLAHACEALDWLTEAPGVPPAWCNLARDVLAQIKEGVVP